MQRKITQFEFPTLEAAWEGINEYLANNEPKIIEHGGGTYSTEMVNYDNVIHIFKSFIPEKFDFGKILGYRYKKWSKLINNYVNMNYLDLVKSEVLDREKKKSSHYNFTMHFDNSHGSGKDCLIALTFCRRKKEKNPFVIYNTRASEATSRLIFDFLLIQRIVEYVYGKGVTVEVICYIPFMFINIERFLLYMGYKGRDVIKPAADGSYNNYQWKCLNKYDDFKSRPLDSIKYKVHKRSAIQLQGEIGHIPHLYAKDLTFPFNKKYKDKDIQKLNDNYKQNAIK